MVSGKSKESNLLRRLYYAIRSGTAPFTKVLRYVPDNAEILDLGCGYGILIDLINSKKSNCRITGVDIDRNRIEVLREKNPRDIFIAGDILAEASRLLSENRKFDCIIVVDVLYLLPVERQKELIQVSSRLLNPSGVFLIKEMDKRASFRLFFTYLQEFFSVKIIKMTKTKDEGFHFMSREEFSSELFANNMQIEFVNMGTIFHPHLLIIGRK